MRVNYSALSGLHFVLLLFIVISSACAAVEPYRIGPEDSIAVQVARHPEFSGDYYVPADGAVDFPGVGRLVVVDKTLRELADSIEQALADTLREPEVTVKLQQPGMQRVYILGSVANPGLYDAKPGWRITEAVAAAGGIQPDVDPSDCRAVILRAATGERETTEFSDVLSGETEKNASILSGDVLTIEPEQTVPVYVMGQVKNPGMYRARKDCAGLVEALALAGGVTDKASITNVSVTRLSGEAHTVDLSPDMLDGAPTCKVRIEPGDLILVPEDNARVAVLGYVNQPGFYQLKNGRKTMLTDALGLANGAERRGDVGKVLIISSVDGARDRKMIDLHKFLKDGDFDYNPEIKSGDVVYVPQTGKLDWDTILRSVTAIAVSINPFVP